MEDKAVCQKLVLPPPSRPLLFLHSQDNKKIAFSSIGDEKHHHVQETPPELHGKEIQAYSQGWFILLDKENQQNWFWNLVYGQEKRYSLWNPLTMESICLPPLKLRAKQHISFCILSSPPHSPDSMLILFERTVRSFISCRIGIGYKLWTHQNIKVDFRLDKGDYLTHPVICNTKLYCHTSRMPKPVKVELSMPGYGLLLPLVLFDESLPRYQETSTRFCRYMVESCGELFVVYLVTEESWTKVISVEVFRLDFKASLWNKVDNIKNKAFFLSDKSSYSCDATSMPEIKGNHVYFTMYGDKSLYSFNMDDKTLSVSLPCPHLPFSWYSSIWVMSDMRLNNILRQTKGNTKKGEIVKRAELEQLEGDFGKLPLDLLFAIGRCLKLHDYMNFRSVNTRFRLETPAIPWTIAAIEGSESYNSLLPLLMFCRKGDSFCNFIDLWGEIYPMKIPNNQLKDLTRWYSREGWCLMVQERMTVFLWNPFSGQTIQLPKLPHEGLPICFVSFSSSIDWVVLISYGCGCYDYIDYIFLEEGQWHSFPTLIGMVPLMGCNNLTFCNGAFYTFDRKGRLFVFKETGYKYFDMAKKPCSLPQRYLVECDGKLLSVFVSVLGRQFRIFKLNEADMVWVEVKNIGNHTIYISHYSCFAKPATHGMENRIYFPRFYNKNAVYYSLHSRKLHFHGSKKVLESFYNTKELLYCGWIQPKGF